MIKKVKSLKRLCSDICWEKGHAPYLWPPDVYQYERRKRFRHVLEEAENEEYYHADTVGWHYGLNAMLQHKYYIQYNIRSHVKYGFPSNHCLGAGVNGKDMVLYYNADLIRLFR